MRLLTALVPVLALGLAACSGQPDTPGGRAANARHENFEAMGDAFKKAGDTMKSQSPDIAVVRAAATTINGFAPKVETWFPKGSAPADGVKTEALDAIWSKPEEFKAANAKLVEQAAAFATAAQGGDLAAVGAAMKGLGGACKGCHEKFREPE